MLIVAFCAFAFNFSKKKLQTWIIINLHYRTYCFLLHGLYAPISRNNFCRFPPLAVGITPYSAKSLDYKGKAATMLIFGSLLLIICHLTFAFILPLFKGSAVGGVVVAYITILVLGASFSLVPASLWPSVPKLVDQKVIGSAYALIFWIQNYRLVVIPATDRQKYSQNQPGRYQSYCLRLHRSAHYVSQLRLVSIRTGHCAQGLGQEKRTRT